MTTLREAAHQPWCASRTQMLLSNPPQPAPCDCQPKAEPVATIGMIDEEHFTEVCRKAGGNSNTLLYAAPQPRRRLTDEEKREMWTNATVNPCTHMHCYLRGIEDAEDAIWSKT